MGKGHQLHYSLKLVWNNEAGRPVVRDCPWYEVARAAGRCLRFESWAGRPCHL